MTAIHHDGTSLSVEAHTYGHLNQNLRAAVDTHFKAKREASS